MVNLFSQYLLIDTHTLTGSIPESRLWFIDLNIWNWSSSIPDKSVSDVWNMFGATCAWKWSGFKYNNSDLICIENESSMHLPTWSCINLIASFLTCQFIDLNESHETFLFFFFLRCLFSLFDFFMRNMGAVVDFIVSLTTHTHALGKCFKIVDARISW